ncbi:MAG: (d)CMP kinase [Aestuariivita sp.]|nr:(d)CMP kinase [Aestuariivita sp.]
MSFAVAVDGPAAAGKGTIAQAIAEHFDFQYLDTGLLYRAVGLAHLHGFKNLQKVAQKLDQQSLMHPMLRTPAVSKAASEVAKIAEVRAALVNFQREFIKRSKGAVLDGRDISTVICPNADVKLYVFANQKIRAKRRQMELKNRGISVDLKKVQNDLRMRDDVDMKRVEAPLQIASDSIRLDTSTLSVKAANQQAIEIVNQKLNTKSI